MKSAEQVHNHPERIGNSPFDPEEILDRIRRAINGVRFGSVEVIIQDSRVVQIERKEKFRFDRPQRI